MLTRRQSAERGRRHHADSADQRVEQRRHSQEMKLRRSQPSWGKTVRAISRFFSGDPAQYSVQCEFQLRQRDLNSPRLGISSFARSDFREAQQQFTTHRNKRGIVNVRFGPHAVIYGMLNNSLSKYFLNSRLRRKLHSQARPTEYSGIGRHTPCRTRRG